jgi:hypothetical protein
MLAFPAGTVTVAGGLAAASPELCRLTINLPVGAMPVRVTVPVTNVFDNPLTVPGDTEIDDK